MILHHSAASPQLAGRRAGEASRVRIGVAMLAMIVVMLGALNLAASLA